MISPAIFALFINQLLVELEQVTDYRLAYCDDLVFVCNSIYECRKAIEVVEKWCAKTGMVINKAKSGIM